MKLDPNIASQDIAVVLPYIPTTAGRLSSLLKGARPEWGARREVEALAFLESKYFDAVLSFMDCTNIRAA